MARVFLIRHGQTDMNVRKIVQGPRLDPPLSEVGRAQARALARRLLPETIAAVYSSPMQRARETAKAVADVHGIPVRILGGLTEYDWGLYCGREETGDTAAGMKSVFDRWWAGELDARPADGESAREAELRVRAAFGSALAEAVGTGRGESAGVGQERDGDLVVVAHGRINKILLASLLVGDLRRQEDYPQYNTAVTVLEPDGAGWRAAVVNDTSHRVGVDIPVGKEVKETNA